MLRHQSPQLSMHIVKPPNTGANIPPHLRKPRLRRRDASEYLAVAHGLQFAPSTLAKLACIGGGPAFHKAGRWPLYPVVELDRWANARLGRLVNNTSE